MENFELQKTLSTFAKEMKEVPRAKIDEYLSESLPEGEVRIAEPMELTCEVAVVIPTYGERKFILRTLLSLAEQEGVDTSKYEAIFVINNPEIPPQRKIEEDEKNYRLRLEQYQQAIKENQETLELLRIIKGQNADAAQINEQEKAVIAKIQSKALRIHFVDKASKGHTLPLQEANVGGARNRGVAEAVERFYKQLQKNGIIAQSDADTRFDKDYIKILIETFAARPELIGLTGNMQFENLDREEELFKKIDVYSELKNLYINLAKRAFEVSKKVQGEAPINPSQTKANDKIWFSGSNMASRAYETAIVGGIPKINGEEDTRFGWKLEQIGTVDSVKELTVFPADRFSARTDTGHGLIRLKEASEAEQGLVANPETIKFVENTGNMFYEALEQGQISFDFLKSLFQFAGESLLNDEDLRSLENHIKSITHREELMNDKVVEDLGVKIAKKLQTLLPDKPAEQAVGEIIEFFCKNPIIERKYKDRVTELLTETEEENKAKLNFLESLAGAVLEENPEVINLETLLQILHKNKERFGLDESTIENFRKNEDIITTFCQAMQNVKSQAEAVENLKATFSKHLSTSVADTTESMVVSLRAMHEVLNEVGERP